MSAGAVAIADPRARELSEAGTRGWYADHVGHSTTCACVLVMPDRTCDLGCALFRLAKSAREAEKRRPGT